MDNAEVTGMAPQINGAECFPARATFDKGGNWRLTHVYATLDSSWDQMREKFFIFRVGSKLLMLLGMTGLGTSA